MGIKLYYFDFGGRGEAIRLAFVVGNVEFEDVRVPREEWPELKKKMPFGTMPSIEVDGKIIGQSGALLTYAAKLAGIYPEDPLEAAIADQYPGLAADLMALFKPTWNIQDMEAKLKARKELVEGPLKAHLEMISKLLEGKEYVAGNKLSHGDIILFSSLCGTIRSGMLDGVPKDLLDSFPVLKAYRNRIASIDAIRQYYAAREDPTYKADA